MSTKDLILDFRKALNVIMPEIEGYVSQGKIKSRVQEMADLIQNPFTMVFIGKVLEETGKQLRAKGNERRRELNIPLNEKNLNLLPGGVTATVRKPSVRWDFNGYSDDTYQDLKAMQAKVKGQIEAIEDSLKAQIEAGEEVEGVHRSEGDEVIVIKLTK